MDRWVVPIDDRLAPLVEAAERGKEVIFTRDGREVARVAALTPHSGSGVFDVAAIKEMQRKVRALGIKPFDATSAVREMRDEGD